MPPRLLAACVALSWGAALAAQQSGRRPAGRRRAAARPIGRVDYQRDIQPLLEARCVECHSGTKRKGGLSLATYADVLEGGRTAPSSGPATAPAAC